MWLENLLSALDKKEIFGTRKVFIKGITDDSRKVRKDYLFIAVKGLRRDGHDFIDEAIKKGARVLVGEKDLKTPISYIKVADSREALGQLSSFWYGIPSKKLKVIGVSGTDGKTTTSNLIYWILKRAGHKVGLISTLGAKIGQESFDTGLHVTNPDPLSLQSLLSRMVNAGCNFAVLEVTSHGLAQGRVVGVNFDIGVLTNVTHEHIDYHKTYKNYALAKAKLFNTVKVAILDKSDKSYKYIKTVLNPDIKVVDYTERKLSSDEKKAIEGRFPEQYNVLNALASISVAKELKIPDKVIADAINTFPGLPGRMEEIKTNKAFKVFVDFAHTPNSLEKALASLRKKLEKKGRLIAVFGSAGERDTQKRAMMGKIAVNLSDISVLTAEDPRGEEVNSIIDEIAGGAIKAGAIEGSQFYKIPERGEAIAFAIQKLAQREDIVAILGKGHEKSMAFGEVEHPWSDKEAVINALGERKDIGVVLMGGGLGKRLKSDIPKALQQIAERPMIALSLENLRRARLGEIVVVVGYKKEEVMKRVRGGVKFAVQKRMLGTADAAALGLKMISKGIKKVVVVNADDSAFYRSGTIRDVIATHEKERAVLTFVSLTKENPTGLGRVVRDETGNLAGIKEEKDATNAERRVKEVNDGLYVFDKDWLEKSLPKVTKSPVSGEYYLVSLVSIALRGKNKVVVYPLKDANEWFGINTREELAAADKKMRERIERILNEKQQ